MRSSEDILDVRTRIAEVLAGCQSEVIMENVGGVDFQAAIGDELQTIAPVAHDGLDAIPWLSTPPDLGPSLQPLAFHAHLLDQNGGPLSQESVGATSTLPQMADPAICRQTRR